MRTGAYRRPLPRVLGRFKGFTRRDHTISALIFWLGSPVIAAALGVLLGAGLTIASHIAASFVTPADPFKGLRIVTLMMGARFAVSGAALAFYYFLMPRALPAFGLALAISFIAGLGIEAVKASIVPASRTSA